MDYVRRDLKRLLKECKNVVLENDDIELILSGKVQEVIDREQAEDQVFDTIVPAQDDEEIDDEEAEKLIENTKEAVEEALSRTKDEEEDYEESEKGEDKRFLGLF